MEQLTERDLVLAYSLAKVKTESAEAEVDKAKAELYAAERALIEMMAARGIESTADYEGVGKISLLKPQLYASCKKEDEEKLFAYLQEHGRPDLIKTAVNARSLSGYVKEKIEAGEALPEYITYFLKSGVRLYK